MKLNLHLEVGSLRDDGYHEIFSLFQAFSHVDDVLVRLIEGDAVLIEGSFDCPPEQNTAYKAALAFFEATGIRAGLSISVNKRIPSQAGLGGGSSDAASVLRALDALFETALSLDELVRLGSKVGSDVPFFLGGTAAIVRGRGESVEWIEPDLRYKAVCVWPGFGVSTKAAFGAIDSARERIAPIRAAELVESYRADVGTRRFGNSFEVALDPVHPEFRRVRETLASCGAKVSMLTGSGSTVFGLFDDDCLAAGALETVRGLWPVSFGANPLARIPAVVLE